MLLVTPVTSVAMEMPLATTPTISAIAQETAGIPVLKLFKTERGSMI